MGGKRKLIVSRRALNKRIKKSVEGEWKNLPCTKFRPTLQPSLPLNVLEQEEISTHTSNDFDNIIVRSSATDTKRDRPFCLETELRLWTLEFNVTHTQLSNLLKILRKHENLHHLPCDSRTLMKTPRISTSVSCPPGKYVHFGFGDGISRLVRDESIQDTSLIKWQLNIDGIPLTKSSNIQFWPILAYASDSSSQPFPIGIYCGNRKPDNCEQFLQPMIEDITNENIKIKLFSCDTPARAFICGVKGHTSFSGCSKCHQIGRTLERRVAFSTVVERERTDEEFRNQLDEDFHNSTTPLIQLGNLNMVQDFPFEYMHLVCLGVMRKLLLLWIRGDRHIFRLSASQVSLISQSLTTLAPFICSDFMRKPRTLVEIDRWKATEFRLILLYTGPIALKSHLPNKHYNLFMSLSVAVAILVNPQYYLTMNNYAEKLLKHFVEQFAKLYGTHNVSFNIHGLLHLAADARRFGPLDSYSAFRFENCLGKLKRMVRSSSNQLAQIEKRIKEQFYSTSNVTTRAPLFTRAHNEPLPQGLSKPQFKQWNRDNFSIKCNSQDSFCLHRDGSVIQIENFVTDDKSGSVVALGKKHGRNEPLFSNPCDSRILGIFKTNEIASDIKTFLLDDLIQKCQVFPIGNNNFAVFPLIHTCHVPHL